MLTKRNSTSGKAQGMGGKPTTLYFTGPNPKNQSGVSWKLWRIRRAGRVIVISWGPAKIVKRRPVFIYEQKAAPYKFPTIAAAQAFRSKCLNAKLRAGYYRLGAAL